MNPIRTELSKFNQDILGKYAREIYSKHLYPSELKKHEKSGFWMTIQNWLPSPFTAGSNLGYAVSITHGADASNWVISKIAHRVMPIPAKQGPETWSDRWKRKLTGYEEASVEETAKLLLTPKVLPIMSIVCSNTGGITFMAAAALVGLLYDRILKDPNTRYSPDKLPEMDDLIKLTGDNKVIDANGNVLTAQDIKDFGMMVNRYDLTCKLLNAKREEIDGIVAKYKRDAAAYSDGSPISETDRKIIQVAAERLKSQNLCNMGDEIVQTINLLADHVQGESTFEGLRDNMLLREWHLIDSAEIEAGYQEYQKTLAYAKESSRASQAELKPSNSSAILLQGD